MRKIRLLAAALAACPVAGLAAVSVPAAVAAPVAAKATGRPATPTHALVTQKFLSPDYNFSCPLSYYHGGPFTKVVNAAGIHIWSNDASHHPKLLYSIAKGAHFYSLWYDAYGDAVGCESPNAESGNGPTQRWVLGWDTSNKSHQGWVGLRYLNSL